MNETLSTIITSQTLAIVSSTATFASLIIGIISLIVYMLHRKIDKKEKDDGDIKIVGINIKRPKKRKTDKQRKREEFIRKYRIKEVTLILIGVIIIVLVLASIYFWVDLFRLPEPGPDDYVILITDYDASRNYTGNLEKDLPDDVYDRLTKLKIDEKGKVISYFLLRKNEAGFYTDEKKMIITGKKFSTHMVLTGKIIGDGKNVFKTNHRIKFVKEYRDIDLSHYTLNGEVVSIKEGNDIKYLESESEDIYNLILIILGLLQYYGADYSASIESFECVPNPDATVLLYIANAYYLVEPEPGEDRDESLLEAKKALEEALEMEPDDPIIKNNLLAVYLELGLTNDARRVMGIITDEDYNENNMLYNNVAVTELRLGNEERAIEILEKEYKPGNKSEKTMQDTNLAFAYTKVGEYEKAVELYDELINDNYENATAHLGYSKCLYKQGDFDKASGELRVAVELSPELGWVIYEEDKSTETSEESDFFTDDEIEGDLGFIPSIEFRITRLEGDTREKSDIENEITNRIPDINNRFKNYIIERLPESNGEKDINWEILKQIYWGEYESADWGYRNFEESWLKNWNRDLERTTIGVSFTIDRIGNVINLSIGYYTPKNSLFESYISDFFRDICFEKIEEIDGIKPGYVESSTLYKLKVGHVYVECEFVFDPSIEEQ